ncbi:TPA: hypothetical protein JG815_004768 [Vibrio parahaemolyticus]|nr:hypothetical protein [Vibrio parahaemolyticus]
MAVLVCGEFVFTVQCGGFCIALLTT